MPIITRREMLARSGQGAAVLALAPLVKAAQVAFPEQTTTTSAQPIEIKTKEAKSRLNYMNRCYSVEVDTPLYEWPNVVRNNPKAFTSYGYSFCEEFARTVISQELASRAKGSFLDKLPDSLTSPMYPYPLNRIDIEIKFVNYLEFQAQKLLDEAKGVPQFSRASVLYKDEYGGPQSYYLRRQPGIFTTFTEDEAVELTDKLKEIPYEEILVAIQNRWTRPVEC